MKKCFSHPRFFGVFLLLGLAGMGLQFWFAGIRPDSAGLLPSWHIATALTFVVVLVAAALAFLSTPHIQMPQWPLLVQGLCAFAAAALMGVAATVVFLNGNLLSGMLSVLAGLGSLYVGLCKLRRRKTHYGVFALFSICFLFYLISRYRVWSAEPETVRYLFQLLALVCGMLVFYQKAALHEHTGKFRTYHFWRCMTLVLSMTAIPSASNPSLYLAAAMWMILDLTPRSQERDNPSTESAAS